MLNSNRHMITVLFNKVDYHYYNMCNVCVNSISYTRPSYKVNLTEIENI